MSMTRSECFIILKPEYHGEGLLIASFNMRVVSLVEGRQTLLYTGKLNFFSFLVHLETELLSLSTPKGGVFLVSLVVMIIMQDIGVVTLVA